MHADKYRGKYAGKYALCAGKKKEETSGSFLFRGKKERARERKRERDKERKEIQVRF